MRQHKLKTRLFSVSALPFIIGGFTACIIFHAAFPSSSKAQQSKQPVIQPVMIQTVTIVDKTLIRKMLLTSLIPEEPTSVDSIQIIDATNNGFGENDMIILHPQQISYTFNAQGPVRKLMKNWKLRTGRKLDYVDVDPNDLDKIKLDDLSQQAAKNMLSGILRTIDHNSNTSAMKVYLEREKGGKLVFRLWGYDEDNENALVPGDPRDLFGSGKPMKDYDVFRTYRTDLDTLINNTATMYDQIYIYRLQTDTLFVAPNDNQIRALHEKAKLPGLTRPQPKSGGKGQ